MRLLISPVFGSSTKYIVRVISDKHILSEPIVVDLLYYLQFTIEPQYTQHKHPNKQYFRPASDLVLASDLPLSYLPVSLSFKT